MTSNGPPRKAAVRPSRGRPRTRPPAAQGSQGEATQARLIAVRVLERVDRTGAFSDLVLHHQLAKSRLSARDRALCTELVCGTLRWRGRLDFLLQQVLRRELAELEILVINTLRLGAYQIFFSDRIPDTAAVDQAVRCAKALGADRASGLVNAALRRLARERDTLSLPDPNDDPIGHLTHALSLPAWLASRWLDVYGAGDAAALARASNDRPPLTVRANRTRTSAAALLEELAPRFPEARPCRWAPDGLVLGHRGDPGRDPAFLAGLFTVQDEASQLVVSLLDPQPGELILDTCAAPGTKTTAIAERMGRTGRVVALDRHRNRLRLVARDARRLGVGDVRTLERDATQPLGDINAFGADDAGMPFDRILVDAPCSGLGALRRNPDARWRVRPDAPQALARTQKQILARAAAVLKPGGRLVYSTCTLMPEENEQLVEGFLKESPSFRILPRAELSPAVRPLVEPGGFLRCLPHIHDTDGFFAACLEKSS